DFTLFKHTQDHQAFFFRNGLGGRSRRRFNIGATMCPLDLTLDPFGLILHSGSMALGTGCFTLHAFLLRTPTITQTADIAHRFVDLPADKFAEWFVINANLPIIPEERWFG